MKNLQTYDFSNRKKTKNYLTFSAILYWEEDVYVAECPEVGTASQGETIEEAIANLQEATELYLEEFPVVKRTHRFLTTFEVAVGTANQGETIEEAIANLQEATELYLEEFPVVKRTHRFLTTFEVANG